MSTKPIYDEANRTSDEQQTINATAAMHNRTDIQQAIRNEIDRPDTSNCTRFTKYELAHICHLLGAEV